MERRTFMLGALASVAPLAWELRSMAPRGAWLVVYDPALAHGRLLARHAATAALPAFALVREDIGALWYEVLAPRLGASGGGVISALGLADQFVLARLALAARCVAIDWRTLRNGNPDSSDRT